MFDQMRAFGAIASLMKDRQKLTDAAVRVRETLEASSVVGTAGGGAVLVTMSGAMKVVGVHVEPALAGAFSADARSRELAQQLIAEATNDALTQAQALVREIMGQEAKLLGLPEELASQIGGPFSSALGL